MLIKIQAAASIVENLLFKLRRFGEATGHQRAKLRRYLFLFNLLFIFFSHSWLLKIEFFKKLVLFNFFFNLTINFFVVHQSLTQRKPNFEMNFASQNKYFVRVSMQVRVTAQLNAHCNIIEVVNPKDR